MIKLILGRDGMIFGAKLKTNNGYLEQAIQHLYPIELCCDILNAKTKLNAHTQQLHPKRNTAAVNLRAVGGKRVLTLVQTMTRNHFGHFGPKMGEGCRKRWVIESRDEIVEGIKDASALWERCLRVSSSLGEILAGFITQRARFILYMYYFLSV